MNTQIKCFEDFQNVCSLHSLISKAAMEATNWVSSLPGISPFDEFCSCPRHSGKMSARALTRSRHFRGRARAERLDSIETIRGKWWQFKNSRHMFSFRGDKAVTKQIRFSP